MLISSPQELMPVTASRVDRPIMRLAVTWLVMVPMFFFACRGILWFQGAGNGLEGTGFQSTAAPKGNGTVEVLVFVFACVFFLLATQLLSVVRLCWSHKIFAALAVYALSTCLWSQFPRLTLQFGIYIVLDVLFVFYLYSRFSPRRLIHVFLLVGWIIVLSSIFFALALPQYGIDHRESTSGAWQGRICLQAAMFDHVHLSGISSVLFTAADQARQTIPDRLYYARNISHPDDANRERGGSYLQRCWLTSSV